MKKPTMLNVPNNSRVYVFVMNEIKPSVKSLKFIFLVPLETILKTWTVSKLKPETTEQGFHQRGPLLSSTAENERLSTLGSYVYHTLINSSVWPP